MLEIAERKIRETPTKAYLRGEYAWFTHVDDVWGLKFYKSEDLRDRSYDLQEKAAAFGLAPLIMDKFELRAPFGQVYGYFTEIAKSIKDEVLDTVGYTGDRKEDNIPEDIYYSDEVDRLRDEVEDSPEHNRLMNSLYARGFDIGDMHWGNVGRCSDGRLVAIDFVDQ